MSLSQFQSFIFSICLFFLQGNTESKHDSKLGMEDALLDKGSEPLFESDSDIAVDKRTDSEINADLSEAEISDVLLCDGVINMVNNCTMNFFSFVSFCCTVHMHSFFNAQGSVHDFLCCFFTCS